MLLRHVRLMNNREIVTLFGGPGMGIKLDLHLALLGMVTGCDPVARQRMTALACHLAAATVA
jgi:hypothetical protein